MHGPVLRLGCWRKLAFAEKWRNGRKCQAGNKTQHHHEHPFQVTFFSLPDLAGLLCSKQLFFVIAFPFNSNANQVLFCPSSSRRFVVIMMPLVCKLKHLLISISKARFRYRTFRTICVTRQHCHPLPVYFRTCVKTKPMTYRNALLRITPPPPPQRLGLIKARMRY